MSNKTLFIYVQLGQAIYAETSGKVVLSETQKTSFSFKPCLANGSEDNCYSMMPVSDETSYVRTIGAGLIVQSTEISLLPNNIYRDASFLVQNSPVEGGFLLFESLSHPGYFITSNEDGMLIIAKRNNGSCFQDAASSFATGLPNHIYLRTQLGSGII